MTNFPIKRWYDKRNHDCAAKQTITSTSVDIKTEFENIKPKYVAEIVDNRYKHESFATTLVRRMSGLDGKTIFASNPADVSTKVLLWRQNSRAVSAGSGARVLQ